MTRKRLTILLALFVLAGFMILSSVQSRPQRVPSTSEPVEATPETTSGIPPLTRVHVEVEGDAAFQAPAREAPSLPLLLRVRAVDAMTDAPIRSMKAFISPADHRGEHELELQSLAIDVTLRSPFGDIWESEGQDGIARLHPTAGAPFTVYVRAPGYVPVAVPMAPLTQGDSRDATVRLVLGSELIVHVNDQTGAAVSEAEIQFMLLPETLPGQGALHARFATLGATDEDGAFSAVLPPDTPLTIRAQSAGYEPQLREARLRPGQTSEMRLHLFRRGTVTGLVTDGGVPVEGALVHFGADKKIFTRSEVDGHYRLEGLPDGEHRIAARLPKTSDAEPASMFRYAEVIAPHETIADFDFGETAAVLYGEVSLLGEAPQRAHLQGTVTNEDGVERIVFHVDHQGIFEAAIPAGEVYLTVQAQFASIEGNFLYTSRLRVASGERMREDFHFTGQRLLSVTVDGIVTGLFETHVFNESRFSEALLDTPELVGQNALLSFTPTPVNQTFEYYIPNIGGVRYVVLVALTPTDDGVGTGDTIYRYERLDPGQVEWDLLFRF